MSTQQLLIILSVIVVCSIAIIYFISQTPPPPPTPGDNPPGQTLPPPDERIREGETITVEDVRAATKDAPAPPPPEPINDPIRFRNLFQEGRTYQTTIRSTIEGRGSKKEWGVKGSVDFAIATKQVFSFRVDSNDGTDIEGVLEIKESAYTNLHTDNQQVRFDLGNTAHRLLDVAGAGITALDLGTIPILPGTSTLVEKQLNKLLESNPSLQQEISRYGISPAPPTIDALAGLEAKIYYSDGKGITRMDILRQPKRDYNGLDPWMAKKELIPLFNHNPVMDLYFFPRESKEVGGEWSVSSHLLPNPFPASYNSRVLGEMHFSRLPDDDGVMQVAVLPGNLQAEMFPSPRTTIQGMLRVKQGKATATRQGESGEPMINKMQFDGGFDFDRLEPRWTFDKTASGRMPTFNVGYEMEIID